MTRKAASGALAGAAQRGSRADQTGDGLASGWNDWLAVSRPTSATADALFDVTLLSAMREAPVSRHPE